MKNIDDLIESCEGIFQGERQAWVSTSLKTGMKGKKDGDDKDGEDKKQ